VDRRSDNNFLCDINQPDEKTPDNLNGSGMK
jgi:hypothetical protein